MGRGRPHKCPYCEATKSVAKGFRYNKGGKVRLRRCKACGRRWTTGLAPDDQSSEATVVEEAAPVPADQFADNAAVAPGHVEETAASDDEIGEDPEGRTELPLSGEGSPSQDDSGEEGKEESEETFFAQ